MRPLSLIFLALTAAPLAAQTAPTADPPQMIEGPQSPGPVLHRTQQAEEAPAAPPSAQKSTQMSNDTVLRMHSAGLADDLIVQTINTQPGQYDTTADALIALKQAGLADPVLAAMANKARHQITHVETTAASNDIVLSPVNEIGIYYKDPTGRWMPMETETVHIKSGGLIKSTVTHGIIKQDHNGVVSGREAKLELPRPAEFLIYSPDGVTASEYEIVRFRLNSKDREFRVLTGGIIHSTGGAQRDDVEFHPVKTAPRTWTFTLPADTGGGEFGILPPGTGNITNGGKIYTFAFVEAK